MLKVARRFPYANTRLVSVSAIETKNLAEDSIDGADTLIGRASRTTIESSSDTSLRCALLRACATNQSFAQPNWPFACFRQLRAQRGCALARCRLLRVIRITLVSLNVSAFVLISVFVNLHCTHSHRFVRMRKEIYDEL